MRTCSFPAAVRACACAAVLAGGWPAAGPAWAAPAQAAPAAAVTVRGTVHDTARRPLPGATVTLGPAATVAGTDGAWHLEVPPGRHVLEVRLDGFDAIHRVLDISAATGRVEVVLTVPLHLREDVVVRAVRAADTDPVTKTDVPAEAIARVNRGQEMPFLLSRTPSINVQSDSGAAAGYAYFNIRGVGQTRLNITLDGIPLQDPEDQALYFSNVGDFASVVDSVQVQRGVGTSSVGGASYGGSVNFASVNPADAAAVEAQAGGGSWGTGRGTVAVHSGRFDSGLALYGRASAQTSNGYRDHSGADQGAVYYGATHQGPSGLFKLFGFSGRTRTQLAYLATDEPTLRASPRTNLLTPDERDRFGQDVVQAQYTRVVGAHATVMAQGYYNGAQGWFRIWDTPREHLQQYGIDGQVVGAVLGATTERGRLGLNWGAHLNTFARDHFMDIVGGTRAYTNTGRKQEASTFLKAAWNTGRAQVWGDAQVRYARFEYEGDQPLGSISWTFVNPRAGVRVAATDTVGVYASAARMSREPARSDMLYGEDNATLPYDLSAVEPERLLDLEAGLSVQRRGLTLKANLYAMEFENEIALTGELSEIGLPVRRNAGRSSRRGVELEAAWTPAPAVRVAGTATFSRNRIDAWTQYYDVYDDDGAWIDSAPVTHRDVPPLLTPGVIVNGEVSWSPSSWFGLDAVGRWVDQANLDNTGNDRFRTPSFFTADLQASVRLGRRGGSRAPRLRVQVTNLFDQREAWPGGYSYLYFTRAAGAESLDGTAYYYPLATRSVYATVEVRF